MKPQSNSSLKLGMTLMLMIFFIFGFITNFNIALKDQVQATFHLSNFMANLVNGVFFFAYFVFSFLCGKIIKKTGYKMGLILGLLSIALGCFLFYPAVAIPSYTFFLLAVFVMATGVVFLQTAANPYVAALGEEKTASSRLNLAQALNGLATTVAPFIVGLVVLTPAAIALGPKAVQVPFLIIGGLVILIAVIIAFLKLPAIMSEEEAGERKSIWKHVHVLLGAIAIFFYVGAEVGISTAIVPYLKQTGMMIGEAAKLAAMYWGGAMVGRFLGSINLSAMENNKKFLYSGAVIILAFFVGWIVTSSQIKDGAYIFNSQPVNGLIFLGIALLNFVAIYFSRGSTNVALGIFGSVAAILVFSATVLSANVGIWALLSIGFFNSIMFPSIFALSVRDLDKNEMPMASGIINTLIVGGSVIPLVMGWFTDHATVRIAIIVPLVSYLYIIFFALKGSKIRK
ncbi:MAG TPA: MFS transporter [Bacteroidales bacterium]|nr:MFS transporter [Bacteroidales bacterium]